MSVTKHQWIAKSGAAVEGLSPPPTVLIGRRAGQPDTQHDSEVFAVDWQLDDQRSLAS